MDKLITMSGGVPLLDAEMAKKIATFEVLIKALKEQEDELRMAIFKAMEESGTVKVETDDFTINYIAATDKETFNKNKFRKDHPDMYDEYITMSPVKASIRITLKEKKDE